MVDKRGGQAKTIYSPCVPSLAATKRVLSFSDQPEVIHVCIYIYVCMSRTWSMDEHISIASDAPDRNMKISGEIKHSLPTYSSTPFKRGSAVQVWLDQAVSCLKKGPSHMHE